MAVYPTEAYHPGEGEIRAAQNTRVFPTTTSAELFTLLDTNSAPHLGIRAADDHLFAIQHPLLAS